MTGQPLSSKSSNSSFQLYLKLCNEIGRLTNNGQDEQFAEAGGNRFFQLYQECLSERPPRNSIASRIRWNTVVDSIKTFVMTKNQQQQPGGVSSLNEYFELSD
jgi:hypothetical protein